MNSMYLDNDDRDLIIDEPTSETKRETSLRYYRCYIIGSAVLHLLTIIPLIFCLVKIHTLSTALSEATKLGLNITNISGQVDKMQFDIDLIVNKSACVNGYVFCRSTNRCFRIDYHSTTWDKALEICQDDGGYLATFAEDIPDLVWIDKQLNLGEGALAETFWIGGQKFPNSSWTWSGKDTGLINTTMFWGDNPPRTLYNESTSCLAMCFYYGYYELGVTPLHDLCFMEMNCTETIDWREGTPIGFICEQEARPIYTNSWSIRQKRPQGDEIRVINEDEGSGDYGF